MRIKDYYKTYKGSYVLYILCIVFLNIFALAYKNPLLFMFPIGIVWLHMLILAIQELFHKKVGNELFLVCATVIAVWGGEVKAIMLVLSIMLIARYMQLLIEEKTSKAVETLIALMPNSAILYEQGLETVLPITHIVPGMHILVKTGARIPADGSIVEGDALINEALLTGESTLKEKGRGNTVFAGTFIESGSIIIRVEKVQEDTLFNQMTRLLQQAEQRKAHISLLTEKITHIFVPAIIVLIIALWLITRNLQLTVTLLIFGSPLELSLIAPLAIIASMIAAFQRGIIIRGGVALEQLSATNSIIFDKTGTLTLGEPRIVHIDSFVSTYTELDILHIAAISQISSDHVIAKSILQKARDEHLQIERPEHYVSLVGHGIEITWRHKRYFFGNKHFIEAAEHGHSKLPQDIHHREAYTTFYLASDGVALGAIHVMDIVRPDAKETIENLAASGIRNIILLSGDRQTITQQIAKDLGIHTAYGEAFPEDKLKLIEQLQKEHNIVTMVGDGINDAAALKQAHVGIAMGAMGMAPAIEAADIILMTNELSNIYFMRALSQKMMRIIKQNLILGFVVLHVLGIILTLAHVVNPVQAAFFHAISDIVMLLNTTRLIHFRPPRINKTNSNPTTGKNS